MEGEMMAAATDPKGNSEGRFQVTEECNGCGICESFAGEVFLSSHDGSRYYVVRQPSDDQEEEGVLDAIEACPLRCIADHGVDFEGD
jgi:ferredoxin